MSQTYEILKPKYEDATQVTERVTCDRMEVTRSGALTFTGYDGKVHRAFAPGSWFDVKLIKESA